MSDLVMKAYKPKNNPTMVVEEPTTLYESPMQRALSIRTGIGITFLEDIMRLFNFKKQETAALIDISTKTLDRHLKSAKPFTGLQSDRLLELAELHRKGKAVFGDNDKFLRWLDTKLPAMNQTTPKEWLDTQQGIKAIMIELGRIQHGIFS